MSARKLSSWERLLYLVSFMIIFIILVDRSYCLSRNEKPYNQQAMIENKPVEIEWGFIPSTLKVSSKEFLFENNTKKEGLLWAARGEFESVQLLLCAEAELEKLPVRYIPAGSNPIPVSWVELFEVLYISTPNTAQWGFPEERRERHYHEYPDPLVPLNGEISLLPGRINSVWIRIRVPLDAVAGEYTGKIAFGNYEAPVSLKVWPFAIPANSSLKTAFGLGGRGLAKHYNLLFGSEEYQELYRVYYDTLLDFRINAYHVPYGGGAAGGSITDPRAKPYLLDERIGSFITLYSGNKERMLSGWEYLNNLGVSHKAWILNIDEPHTEDEYQTILKQAELLQDLVPGLRYGVTFYTGPPWTGEHTPVDKLASSVDLWIMQTNYYCCGYGSESGLRDQLHRLYLEGNEIWLYVALAPREPFCNFFINNSSLQHRMLFWQLFGEEIVSGLLYWQTTYWLETEDPYIDQATVKKIDPGLYGDGSLFYPGYSYGLDRPVGSIRLENIRDGLEDYEYLVLAEQVLGREETMRLVREIAPGFTSYIEDPYLFEEYRKRLGEELAERYAEN